MSVAAAQIESVSYEDLYRRWEEGNWRATEIDFSRDVEGWRELTEIQRRSALWFYSMFFYGEDSVADNLSPYIDAAPKEEQKYFLTTQQVDEARHAVFFHRFFKEVIGAGESIGAGLAYTQPQLNWNYRKVFEILDRTAEELRRDRSLPMFAKAITMYHLVVEALLAQPGQHFIEDFFDSDGRLPGFQSGMSNVSRDEQRHIGFGVKVLSELYAESEECKAATVELLREVMRYTTGLGYPPNGDREYTRCYGFELEDILGFGFRSLETKFRMAGFPIEEMPPDVFPFDLDLSVEERARRIVALMDAGVLGPPSAEPDRSPETQERVFELIARSVNHDAVNGAGPVTIQWRFTDADPWAVVIDNGSTRIETGEHPGANLTFETSWPDFVHYLVKGHGDPRVGMLRRKIRPHGSLRLLAKLPKIFP